MFELLLLPVILAIAVCVTVECLVFGTSDIDAEADAEAHGKC